MYPTKFDNIHTLRKRFLASLLTLVICVSCLGLVPPAPADASVLSTDVIGDVSVGDRGLTVSEAPNVDATHAVLATSDGTILWQRDTDTACSIASITKIMTAVVALENMSPDDYITIVPEAAAVGESSANIVAGAQVTLDSLLHGLLISSGNDAAVAIAYGVGGSEDNFVAMMNAKAAELGMTNTYFENPHGLEEGNHHSCASDILLLSQYAMKKQEFRDIVCLPEYTVNLGGGDETLTTTNEMLNEYEGAIGIKTGFTDEAGYCLSSAVSRNGVELYAVCLGASNATGRFDSCENLCDWGFEHYRSVTLCDTTTTVASIPSLGWQDKSVPAVCSEAKAPYVFDLNSAITQNVTASDIKSSVKKGDVIGSVNWTQNGNVIATCDLVASEDCAAPNFFEAIGIWFSRLFGGDPDTQQLEIYTEAPSLDSPLEGQDQNTQVQKAA